MVELNVVIDCNGISNESAHLEMKINENENSLNKKKNDEEKELKQFNKKKSEKDIWNDEIILKLFGKSFNEIEKEYNMMDGLNIRDELEMDGG